MIISYIPSASLRKSLCSVLLKLPCSSTANLRHCQLFSTLQHTLIGYQDEQLHDFLHKCTKAATLKAVQSLHALTITLGSYARQSTYFANNIISLYASFHELQSAHKVFDKIPQKNLVSYNALMSAYSRNEQVDDAWELFSCMWICGFRPTQFTVGGLLSCSSLDLKRGFILHGLMLKNGLLFAEPHAGTALIGMFGRHGCIDKAVRVFEDMPHKSLVTWNSVISLLGYHGFMEESMLLFREMMRASYKLSEGSIVGLLSGFTGEKPQELGQQVHSLVIKTGLTHEVSTSNSLLNMCVKCMNFSLAVKMFEEMPFRDVVTYNTLIGPLARSDSPGRGLELLCHMLCEGILPNKTTYVGAINCSANLRIQLCGDYVHSKVIKNSMKNYVSVGSALVDFYGKCDMLVCARRCFDEICDRNVVSWNSLIAAVTSKSQSSSLSLFQEMFQFGYCPNEFTFSAVLKVSSVFELQQVHCLIIRTGYLQHEYVFSSLITSYAKNGLISDALLIANSAETPIPVVSSNVIAAAYSRKGESDKSMEILSKLDEPDIISWNILVSTCSHNGYHTEAFEVLKHMLELQIYPDNYTIVSVLCSCTSLRCLAFGISIHGLLIKSNFERCDTFVCNTLIDMYAKCGCVEDSVKVFDATQDKNLITWTTIISALGHHGFVLQALERFKEMELLGIKPDTVSFVAVLSACRHGGLVEEGMALFSRMQRLYDLEPGMDHYHGVVDLLARHGHLKEAEQVIASMPFPPNALIWRSFLEGCKRHVSNN
ncbi:pentatricopeptide repeat-containing protein At3g58590 [Chenopodium quinoa]|uniref:Pentatricopeptide repeat-containing protein n=1 Tax=Chenopodium quinoa TaxID=63459 RepID=A0A803MYF8_CHEQI|nr:pentatricopeptide repeat-containing protein At3g58590 [Chenopodium quinoa]XP_021750829.1 pentatricopeptide repeat-containing protein At3g58590 [Chenopodium quinoa]XP_021750835.1 pentatricopeptide repeat-containing protein At3g58590 [Chenopodium quinoa]XP_021750840.1 pentatricopeptide repeat-containing protein At3g58590 [Chenopodium quinoa]XP_021750848.1 pentatricopeptide repeat-containing protein At3g58590 [Chenopodium quinoa]